MLSLVCGKLFSLLAFRIFSLTFVILIMIAPHMGLFGLCAFCTWDICFFFQIGNFWFGNFLAIISSNTFLTLSPSLLLLGLL